MKDMGIVHGAAEQAVPLVIGYDKIGLLFVMELNYC